LLKDMGWTARDIFSDEVECMRCFLCCDITVIVPYEFAADVDTKELSRSDSLQGSAVGVVLCLYWSSFPCKDAGLTLGRVELKLTNRPGFSGTVPVWDTQSQNPKRCLRDAQMSRFSSRRHGRDRTQST